MPTDDEIRQDEIRQAVVRKRALDASMPTAVAAPGEDFSRSLRLLADTLTALGASEYKQVDGEFQIDSSHVVRSNGVFEIGGLDLNKGMSKKKESALSDEESEEFCEQLLQELVGRDALNAILDDIDDEQS